MMPEISLNILDVAQNSVTAGASMTSVLISADTVLDKLTVSINDNGKGMDENLVSQVINPFFTTRTTRKVGLGVPFFKMAAEISGGSFSIQSTPGDGTVITAEFGLAHIDRMPLGDIAATYTLLVGSNPLLDFVLSVSVDGRSFKADTRDFRAELGDIGLDEPEVLDFIGKYVRENIETCDFEGVL
jgi:anti-sigma regulatory factor (Ser/Thr protein kinase)